MKIALAFLLVALGCCYEPAAANCMSRCAKSCGQVHMADLYCLKQGLLKNFPGTLSALANFLCAYDRCKTMKDKTELVRAIINLKAVTRCSLTNILGNNLTVEQLIADVDGSLQYVLRAVLDLLSGLNIGMVSTPICGPLKPLVAKINQLMLLLGVPRLDGQIQSFTGINGRKSLLIAVANKSPGFLSELLEVLLGRNGVVPGLLELIFRTVGGLSGTLSGVTSTVGGVTNALTKTVEGLTSSLGGTKGGLLGGVTNSVNGLTKSLIGTAGGLISGLGTNGLINGAADGILSNVPGIIRGATNSVNGLTKSLIGTVGGLTSGLGTNGLINGAADGILSNVPGIIRGATKSITDTVGGMTSGLEMNGLLNGQTGLIGGVTNALGEVTDTAEGLTSGLRLSDLFSGATAGLGGMTNNLGGAMDVVDGLASGLGSVTVLDGYKGIEGTGTGVPSVLTGGLEGVTDTIGNLMDIGGLTGGVTNADIYASAGTMGGLPGSAIGNIGFTADARGGLQGGLYGAKLFKK